MYHNRLLKILFLIFLSCNSCHEPKVTDTFTDDDCGLANINYQEVTDTVRVIQSGDLKTGVLVNGKAIINPMIKVDSIAAYINNGDKVFIDQTTFKVFKVSEEFWNNYTKNRQALCALIEAKKKHMLDSINMHKAGELYMEIVSMFSGLDEERERRKIEEEKKPIINTFKLNIENIEIDNYNKIIERIEKTSNLSVNYKSNYQYKFTINFDTTAIKFDDKLNAWNLYSLPILLSVNNNPSKILKSIKYSASSTDRDLLKLACKSKMIEFLTGYNYDKIAQFE